MSQVEVYLLAAGRGERMGASKPMLPFGNRTVLACMCQAFHDAGMNKIRVIGRGDDADLAKEAFDLGARFVFNLEPERGMAGSVIEALNDCTSDWMSLCPADMPMLTTQTISDCVAALADDGIVQPECEGRRRHPVFIHIALRFELRCFLEEGGNLREFLHERLIKTVPTHPCGQFSDIDSPEDYERLLEEAGFGRN